MTSSLTTQPAATVALSQEFEGVRKLYRHIKMHLTAGSSLMILMGLELKRLKKNLGETRGRKNPNASGISWGELVQQEVGITDDTATKYILMAEGSKKRIPMLEKLEEKLLTAPLSSLTEAEQQEITAAVQNLTDGKTAKEVMQELGIARKDAGANLDKDRHKGGNSTKPIETPEQQAQGYFGSVTEHMIGLRTENITKWETLVYSLPLARDPNQKITGHVSIEDLEEELTNWLGVVQTAKERMAKAMHASKTKDAKARETEAREQILDEEAKALIAQTKQHPTLKDAATAIKEMGTTEVLVTWPPDAPTGAPGNIHILVTAAEREAWTRVYGKGCHVGYEGPGKDFKLPPVKKPKPTKGEGK
ncbi:hypothetical protein [Verrucomicrobium spinosum]|uniref:hypothetical protein n=1 Tax=Verrucomicrobium spinosum TaxID=2736 RepID=UPI000174668E|nr:hypothetical protein [Verrucomicrobium spinosum]